MIDEVRFPMKFNLVDAYRGCRNDLLDYQVVVIPMGGTLPRLH